MRGLVGLLGIVVVISMIVPAAADHLWTFEAVGNLQCWPEGPPYSQYSLVECYRLTNLADVGGYFSVSVKYWFPYQSEPADVCQASPYVEAHASVLIECLSNKVGVGHGSYTPTTDVEPVFVQHGGGGDGGGDTGPQGSGGISSGLLALIVAVALGIGVAVGLAIRRRRRSPPGQPPRS